MKLRREPRITSLLQGLTASKRSATLIAAVVIERVVLLNRIVVEFVTFSTIAVVFNIRFRQVVIVVVAFHTQVVFGLIVDTQIVCSIEVQVTIFAVVVMRGFVQVRKTGISRDEEPLALAAERTMMGSCV
jgi:hypothetical protein